MPLIEQPIELYIWPEIYPDKFVAVELFGEQKTIFVSRDRPRRQSDQLHPERLTHLVLDRVGST
jgi:hypothetical protein